MNFVQIEGVESAVRRLRDLRDVILVPATTEFLGGGRIRMDAFATDRAIGEIEERGASVTVLEDNDDMRARFADLDASIEGREPPPLA